jgi:hypothetical protein
MMIRLSTIVKAPAGQMSMHFLQPMQESTKKTGALRSFFTFQRI